MSRLDDILSRYYSRRRWPWRRGRIILALPEIRKKGHHHMANFELKNDQVATVSILTTNAAGVVEPAPAGDQFSVSSSDDASLGAEIGQNVSGGPAIVLTPKVPLASSITVTVSDSAGLAIATQLVDIVEDATPTNIVLDLAHAAFSSQPVPAAPAAPAPGP